MKKPIYFVLLVGTLGASCHKAQPDPNGSDLAATMSGNWKAYNCGIPGGQPGTCTGSLILTRLDATHLKGDFKLPPASPFSATCNIEITAKDTLFGCPGAPGYYRNGQIQMTFGDGVLEVKFKKEQ